MESIIEKIRTSASSAMLEMRGRFLIAIVDCNGGTAHCQTSDERKTRIAGYLRPPETVVSVELPVGFSSVEFRAEAGARLIADALKITFSEKETQDEIEKLRAMTAKAADAEDWEAVEWFDDRLEMLKCSQTRKGLRTRHDVRLENHPH